MSLKITRDFSIPEETKKIALASFPKGNKYIKIRDEMGNIFYDEDFYRFIS